MDEPRRLTRSSESSYVAGVAGGLGRYFGLDPVLFRVAFGVSIVFGGIGLLAYVALWLFLPRDDGTPSFMDSRSRATSVAAIVVLGLIALTSLGPPSFILGPGLLACAALVAVAVLLYRSFGGDGRDDPARMIARGTLVLLVLVAALGAATGVGFIAAIGGGMAEAVLAIVAGLGLIAAGLLGGPRWLMLPAVVLVLPLAVVTAAGIDLHGGVGQRDYRPATVADLRPEYRLGAGELDLDLRRDAAARPAARTSSSWSAWATALVRAAARRLRQRPTRRSARAPPTCRTAGRTASTSTSPARRATPAPSCTSTREVGLGYLRDPGARGCA